MKSNKTNKQYPVAWPLALCYGLGVRLRNLCFGLGILPSETYPIAVISVGNLSAGGAGKTPLVEYLVRLLSPRYRVAVLSRGYRRKTKGYVLASASSTAREIGDEPSQIKRKYPSITVAAPTDGARAKPTSTRSLRDASGRGNKPSRSVSWMSWGDSSAPLN